MEEGLKWRRKRRKKVKIVHYFEYHKDNKCQARQCLGVGFMICNEFNSNVYTGYDFILVCHFYQ
jgi:hypothetical protein